MVSDISGVDNAILNRLATDATIAALAPGGVHWDLAPQAMTAFVVITRGQGETDPAFQGDGLDRFLYDIKGVIKSSSPSVANDVAYRIHELFHHATLDVSAGAYTFLFGQRIYPIRYRETEVDTAVSWHHHGGQYEFLVCPAA